MRIPVRTSKAATWSRRLAGFALPLVVFSVLAHRLAMVTSSDFFLLLGGVELLAVLAIVLALVAFVRLWRTGHRGWSRAVAGLLVGILLLVPLVYAAVEVARTPFANDVTTGTQGTPPLAIAHNPNANPLYGPKVAIDFPGAVSRFYAQPPGAVMTAAEKLAGDWGWNVRQVEAPATDLGHGEFHAVVMTLLGWRDEVAVAVNGTPTGTELVMRSASFTGHTDLGANGRRIAAFLHALDGILGETGAHAKLPAP